jgi:hypothetical protein
VIFFDVEAGGNDDSVRSLEAWSRGFRDWCCSG